MANPKSDKRESRSYGSTSRRVDVESAGLFSSLTGSVFSDKSLRNGFIQKVYGILAFMLLVTFIIVSIVRFNESANRWFFRNTWIMYIALGIYLVTAIPLICCHNTVGRRVPWNYIILGLFTSATSLMVASICCAYDSNVILISAGITFIVVLSVSLFSCTTSFDFTKLIWIMVMVIWVFLLFTILVAFYQICYGQVPLLQLFFGFIGVTIFTIFLAIDTQLIMGGNKYELNPEDYVFGALALYLDIINIFIYMLKIVKGCD